MTIQQKITGEAGDDKESAGLFQSYPCSLYYIESPSAASYSAQSAGEAAATTRQTSSPASGVSHRHALSSYYSPSSSSRNSSNSFAGERKLKKEIGLMKESAGSSVNNRVLMEGEDGAEEEAEEERGLMAKLVVLQSKESLSCKAFQVGWRLAASLGLGLLVFFFATRPPPPEFSFKIMNVRHFSLGEGVDDRGVPTKILSCNCSLEMDVDNKSHFFGLHIHPPLLEIYFGRLKFASSQGLASYVDCASSSVRRLFVGVRNKPMYGAGSSMQDLLESGHGLSLTVRIQIRFSYQIVWGLLKMKHHKVEDCIIILHGTHDPRLHAKMYETTCSQS